MEMYALLSGLKNSGINLVAYVVEKDFKIALQYVDKDDLVGYGVFGLLRAAREYDPAKGIGFPAFAYRKIKQAVLDFVSQKCQRQYTYIVDSGRTVGGTCNQQEEYDIEDEREYVRRAVDSMPAPHREFVNKYFLQETPVKEMLKTTGMKRHRLFQLRAQALVLLKRRIKEPAHRRKNHKKPGQS